MTQAELRNIFPQLSTKVYGKDLVYLDNSATSMRPVQVLEKWREMSVEYNANIHRAVHYTAEKATGEFESARQAVADFIGADKSEIVFTSGTTNSLNLLAFSYCEKFVKEGDEIVVGESEHHSNLVPWQMAAERKGAAIKVLPVDETGHLEIEKLESLISERTKLVCVAHISNVLGLVNPIEKIIEIAHSHGCHVSVDGAQGIVHRPVDVKKLDSDFYSFSGHKIYAATGTGVLYGKKELLEQLPPYMGGGEMIETVKWTGTTYNRVPYRFEAGTQNLAGVPTFVEALKIASEMRNSEIESEERRIREYVLEELGKIEGLRLYGVPRNLGEKVSVFSFTIDGLHHEDIALILDKMGVAVRSGQMCAEPLMDRYGVSGMVRASFAPYNTFAEAEYFIKALKRAVSMLK